MRTIISLITFSLLTVLTFAAFPNFYPKNKPNKISDDSGLPLILTPLIEQGEIEEALNASEVFLPGSENFKSYSGYFTVNEPYNSNLFFWFFPSQTNYEEAPVVLWLQGGPGASSLFGLFTENGPFRVNSDGELEPREYSWAQTHSVIYIDNPAGTGFSFTDNGFCENQTQVGLDLYEALQQFFTLFPELQQNDFFVTGESYGGKYVPAIAYTIHTNNPTASLKINLQGIAIGNGLSDPEHQLNYADYIFQLGLIDSSTQTLIKQYQDMAIQYIQNEDWRSAFDIFNNLLMGDLANQTTLFTNVTGISNYYNYLYAVDPSNDESYMDQYLQRDDVKAAIHVGNVIFDSQGEEVEIHLIDDIMQSITPWIIELLSNYRVLLYNGQLDIIVAYPMTVNYLQNLNFNAADEYKTAERYQWHVDNDVAGYVKQAGNLTEILVRDAGHMVPADQPKWAFDLISRFTSNTPFH